MAFNETQNKDIVNFTQDKLKMNPVTDFLPKQVVPSIQPTIEVNRQVCNIVRHGVQTTTGSITVFTTPSGTDFYLNSVYASFNKDATCDSATGVYTLSTTIEGTARRLLDFPIFTTTAQSNELTLSFPIPLKIDRNVAIAFSGTFTAGACVRCAGITGFTEEAGNNLSV